MPCPLLKYTLLILLTVLVLPGIVHAQKMIACTGGGGFVSLDVFGNNCQYNYMDVATPTDSLPVGPFSIALYKDTIYFDTPFGDIYRFVLGSITPAVFLTHSSAFNTLTVDKNGVLYYLSNNNTLTTYDPHTNISHSLGIVKFSPGGDLVFYNDKLILAAWEGLVEININKPEESRLYMPTPGYGFYSLINVAVACNQNIVYGIAPTFTQDSSDLIEIDMVNKKILGKRCTLPISIYDAGSITETGGYEGVTINNIKRLSCNGITDSTGIQVEATTASTDSLLYILNSSDSNYTGKFYNLASGAYYFTVKTTSGCTGDTTVHINASAKIKVQLQVQNDNCDANKGIIQIKNENPSSLLSVSLNNSSFSSALYYSHLDTGNYFISIKDTTYCELDTTAVIHYGHFTPANFLGKDTAMCMQQTLLLKAPAYTNAAYLWQDGSTAPEYTISKEGMYSLSLQTVCGSGTDSIQIQYQHCNCDFYIPTAFTPNGDGLNDLFNIRNHCLFTNFKIQVFNRLGQPVYQSGNADNGWDGTLHHLPQPAGTYIWKLAYFDISNKKTVTDVGTVVLIR